jgi:hypothetical protein
MSRERNVRATQFALQREIREFVRVMAAYPELVAREPNLSFEEYCGRFFVEEARPESER